jgi:hypothetical protein
MKKEMNSEGKTLTFLKKVIRRFDTIESSGLEDVRISGIFSKVKGLHGPITYIVLGFMAGFKYKWCFRNPYYWFAMAFCVKWYRARYVFKIPVWDRQPNWNNIITSKEQEKDLKAFTCKNCGSTIFIAKTREFFFEGDTGIGGLGCFSCGAKGADNFIMDRDRIVEDVADIDDYFEYERPLDFVSAAERRKLLKEAGGDEETANKLLMDRENEASGGASEVTETVDTEVEAVNGEIPTKDEPIVGEEDTKDTVELVEDEKPVVEKEPVAEVAKGEEKPAPKPEKKESPSTKKSEKKNESPSDDFDLSDLGMDDF